MEIPDLTAVDRELATDALLSELIRGDFEAVLHPDAFDRLQTSLKTLRSLIEISGQTEGSFIVHFSGRHKDRPEIYRRIPEWLSLQYRYGLDEEGELEFGPDTFKTRTSHLTDPTLKPVDAGITYDLFWEDVNWDGGFAIALGQMPDELLHRN